MAVIGQITVDQISIYEVDADPSVGGIPATIGSIASLYDGTNSRIWIKSGATDTGWSIVPRLSSGTPLTQGGFVFADANGNLITNTARAYWDGAGRFSFGSNAPAIPQSTIHLDRGTGVGTHIRMTAGATTGQTSGDGSEFGIDDTGAAEIRQFENSAINFYTNNLLRASITSDGKLISGPTSTGIDITGSSAIPQFQIVGTSAVQMAGIQYSADTIGPVFNLLKSRGATIGAQGLVSSGDEFGRIQFRASDGVNFQAGASIRALVDGTASAGSMPGYLILMTTPTGATVPVERMRIDSTGQSIFSANIRLGNGTDTTNGNLRFDGSEFLVRQGGSWRNGTIVPTVITSGTGSLSTTSATYSTITGLTNTPAAGTYLVYYSVNVNITANSNGDVAIFLAGNEQTETTRNLGITNSLGTSTNSACLSAMTVVTVNGSQVVDVRFRENGGGTLAVTNKCFVLIPIAR